MSGLCHDPAYSSRQLTRRKPTDVALTAATNIHVIDMTVTCLQDRSSALNDTQCGPTSCKQKAGTCEAQEHTK